MQLFKQLNAHNTKVIVLYHIAILLAFGAAYFAMDFEKHFGVAKPSPATRMYFAATVHSSVGFGDITAKTDAAKAIVSAHMLLAWIPIVLIFI